MINKKYMLYVSTLNVYNLKYHVDANKYITCTRAQYINNKKFISKQIDAT